MSSLPGPENGATTDAMSEQPLATAPPYPDASDPRTDDLREPLSAAESLGAALALAGSDRAGPHDLPHDLTRAFSDALSGDGTEAGHQARRGAASPADDDPSPSLLRTRTFLEHVTYIVPSVIYVFNQQTQTNEYANRSLGAALGYSPSEVQEMGGDLIPRLTHPEDLDRVYAHFTALKTLPDAAIAQIEYRMRHKDGAWTWLLSTDTVFDRDETGKVIRHLGTATDITAQKRAEEQARSEQRAAAAASEELRAFAYAISHDLKAPTNTLSLLLSELQSTCSDALSPDAADLVSLARNTTSVMGRIIEEVLDYTRIVGNSQPHEPVNLTEIADETHLALFAEIQKAGGRLDIGPLPSVLGNSMQLRTLISNLVGNAIKFRCPTRPPVARIYATFEPKTGRVLLSVADNGIGIAPENTARIFEMFARLHLQDDYPGTGLGLALCKRIAINHGGEITVRSTPGEGATFTVSLPQA